MACVRKRRGKWVADYRDPNGKRRWITHDTKKAAEDALAQVRTAISRSEYVAPDTNRTLAEVHDHWWKLCVVGSDNKRGKPASAGTQGFYSGIWSRYFMLPKEGKPDATETRFAPRRLRTITAAEVAEWKQALSLRVGPRSVGAALQMLDALFRHAHRFGWAVTNPCEHVHRPKHKAKVRALTPAELGAILAKVPELEHAPADTALLLKTKAALGLRASELFGLRPCDIDFTTGRVSIKRQLKDGVALDVKSEKSQRDVYLPAVLLKEFREHPRRFLADEPIFVSPEGCAIRISNFHRQIWKPLLKLAGIPLRDERGRVTFHSLRHTRATAAIANGENPVTVASALGHANANVTLAIYADEWAARERHGTEGIAEILFGSKTVAVDKQGAESEDQKLVDSPEDSGTWSGGPCRSRTYDQEIKSLLLYQLS